jgi:Heterokaryon incompatibility protein (HET)
VDALCIVQDDSDLTQRQINNMAAVYAGAFVTIVAAQGDHADAGLRGIRQGSTPRRLIKIYSTSQEVTSSQGLLGTSYQEPHPGTTEGGPFKRVSSRLVVLSLRMIL